jgi:VanZ family protein
VILFPWTWPKALKQAAYATANAILLYLCLAPTSMLPKEHLWDKAEHSISWAVLAGVGLLLWPAKPRAVAIYALFLGALVEVLQAIMPLGRDGDWRDWVADSVGVAAALLVWAVTRRLLRRR